MAVETLPPRTSAPSSESEPPAGGSRGLGERLRDLGSRRLAVAAFVLLLTLASLYLRSGQLNFYYWIDEAISVGISSHPLGQLPHLLREDGSPPLYYVVLHFWMKAFGRGEVATHWLSLTCALITVPVSYLAGSSLFGRRTGVFTAVLAAGVPFLTSYAQETRMYALLLLLSVLVAASFVHVFIERHRRYLPLFSLSLAASLYTHNWALFMGVATFLAYLFCLWATPRLRRELVRDGLIGFGVAGLLFVPWLPTVIYQARHTGAPWALRPVFWSLPQAFYFITGGRGAAMTLALAGGFGLLAAGTGVLVRGPRWVSIRSETPGQRSLGVATIALAILGFGTLLIAWAYAKTTPAWSGRYLAVVVGPMILLTGLGLSRARGLGVVALVFVCLFWVLDPRATSRDAKSNVASMAQVMNHRVSPTTLVLSTQPEQVPTLAYYMPEIRRFATPLGPVPDPGVMDWRNALDRFEHSSVRGVLAPLVRSLRPGQRVLLVMPTSFAKQPMWIRLIYLDSVRWSRYLEHDPRLRLIKSAAPAEHKANVGVRGRLYVVR